MADADSPSPQTILDALDETFDSFQGVLSELSPGDWHKPTGCPGWDVQDVVSHIIGAEVGLAAPPEPPAEAGAGPGVRDETNRSIAADVEARRRHTPAQLREEFAEVTAASMARRRASNRRADEITDGPFGWKLPYDRLLSIRTFDVLAHEQDVRRSVGRPGNLDGRAAALAEGLILEVLNGTLRRRVAALEGHRVRIEVTDRTKLLVLSGTSGHTAPAQGDGSKATSQRTDTTTDDVAAGHGAGDHAETTIRMPFSELMALACGRADVAHELITIDGDKQLADEVLAQMGFTP